jgi:hypothetical protein
MDLGIKLPVVHFLEPGYPDKQRFANFITEQLGLAVYTPPPSFTALRVSERENCLVRHYDLAGERIEVPLSLEPSETHCGVDLYNRPQGGIRFPWTSYLHGHRSSDVDATYGAVPLKSYSHVTPLGTKVHFPLRDWTDAHIWEYLSTKPLAPSRAEYESRDHWIMNDKLQACTRCMFQTGGTVFCPKVKKDIAASGDSFTLIPKQKLNYLQS